MGSDGDAGGGGGGGKAVHFEETGIQVGKPALNCTRTTHTTRGAWPALRPDGRGTVERMRGGVERGDRALVVLPPLDAQELSRRTSRCPPLCPAPDPSRAAEWRLAL